MASEPFLPQTTPTSSPYFQKVARRNLTLELSDERGTQSGRERSSAGGRKLPPWDFNLEDQDQSLGPRKVAVVARKRLPLGDIFDQPPTSSLKDYLTHSNPSNREGLVKHAILLFLVGRSSH